MSSFGSANARSTDHTLFYRRRRSGGSKAALLLGSNSGVAIDFTDQSIKISDTITPANSFGSIGNIIAGQLVGPAAKLTYTSPSAKLLEQSDGVLRYQAHNLYLNSAAPANQSITVQSGASYTLTLAGTVSITLSGATTGTVTAGSTVFTAATGTLTCGSTSGSGTVHLRLTLSNTDYIATTSAPVYDLPYYYNTSGVCQGLMVEDQRTNLYWRSQQFGTGSWAKGSAATITADAAISPDGTSNADLITCTSTGTQAYVVQAVGVSGSSAYATSVYAKAGTASWLNVTVYDGVDGNRYWFNLGAGTVGSTAVIGAGYTGVSASISALPNGWYRCTVVATTKVGSAIGSNYIAFTDADASLTLTSGKTGYLWQAQLELGPNASSPIVTYGSAVVRAADVLSLITSLFPYDGTLGTLFVDVTFKDVTGFSRGLVSTNNSDGRQIVQFSNIVFSHDGTTQLNSGTITASRTSIALSYGGGARSLSRNGTMDVTNGAFDGAFGGSGILYIGSTGGVNILIGTIHRIGYFTTKASNSVLPTIGA